jgi:hypothetical protein
LFLPTAVSTLLILFNRNHNVSPTLFVLYVLSLTIPMHSILLAASLRRMKKEDGMIPRLLETMICAYRMMRSSRLLAEYLSTVCFLLNDMSSWFLLQINCGLFRNIVVNDFLKGLLGLGIHERSPEIDLFTVCYSSRLHLGQL